MLKIANRKSENSSVQIPRKICTCEASPKKVAANKIANPIFFNTCKEIKNCCEEFVGTLYLQGLQKDEISCRFLSVCTYKCSHLQEFVGTRSFCRYQVLSLEQKNCRCKPYVYTKKIKNKFCSKIFLHLVGEKWVFFV